MTKEQVEELIDFVRRECAFAEFRAKGMTVSPRMIVESSQQLRDVLVEEPDAGN